MLSSDDMPFRTLILEIQKARKSFLQIYPKVVNLESLANLIDKKKPVCICGNVLKGSGLSHYGPHDGGVLVEGYNEKRWVYVHCSCGYDMALWKIENELK